MAKFEIKSKSDLDAFAPLADGVYKVSWGYNVKGDDGLLKQTSSVFDLTVSDKGTKYKAASKGTTPLDGDLAVLKGLMAEVFAEGHIDPQIAIDPVPAAASNSTTATASTDGPPWLLIAGAAVLAYVLLRKK